MKKIFLLFSIFICSLSVYSQTLTPSATSIISGATITLTGTGETADSYFWNASYLSAVTIASPYSTDFQYVNGGATIGNLTNANFYNQATQQKTAFQVTLINTSTTLTLTVTYEITMGLYDYTTLTDLGVKKCYFTVTIAPAPIRYNNVPASQVFYKTGCGSTYFAPAYTYTVQGGTYHSTISQADANNQAQADINANGQNMANANSTCQPYFYNTATSGTFYDQACSSGYYGATPITYNVPASRYNSKISQADADAQAAADITANGQIFANSTGSGSCILVPAPTLVSATPGIMQYVPVISVNFTLPSFNFNPPTQFLVQASDGGVVTRTVSGISSPLFLMGVVPGHTYTITVTAIGGVYGSGVVSSPVTVAVPLNATTYYSYPQGGNFTKNDCGSGYTGSSVTYITPVCQFSSTISQADANAQASAYLAAHGQAYANANGTCAKNVSFGFAAMNTRAAFSVTVNGSYIGLIGNIAPGVSGISGAVPSPNSNATIVFTLVNGTMPNSASLSGVYSLWGGISGNTITFTNANLTNGEPAILTLP